MLHLPYTATSGRYNTVTNTGIQTCTLLRWYGRHIEHRTILLTNCTIHVIIILITDKWSRYRHNVFFGSISFCFLHSTRRRKAKKIVFAFPFFTSERNERKLWLWHYGWMDFLFFFSQLGVVFFKRLNALSHSRCRYNNRFTFFRFSRTQWNKKWK